MAKKKPEARIFMLENQFVIIKERRIIGALSLNEKCLKKEIIRNLSKFNNNLPVSRFFLKVLSGYISIPAASLTTTIIIGQKPVKVNIHDSSLYRKYEAFILDQEPFIHKKRKEEPISKNPAYQDDQNYYLYTLETHTRLSKMYSR